MVLKIFSLKAGARKSMLVKNFQFGEWEWKFKVENRVQKVDAGEKILIQKWGWKILTWKLGAKSW